MMYNAIKNHTTFNHNSTAKYRTRLSAKSALCLSVFSAFSALSLLPQASRAADADLVMLDEITVTARKISENLQQVPVSVTAFGARDLSHQGIEDITELQQRLPNTTLQVSRGTNSTLTAYIRGIGQQDPLWGFEPGVGIYIDGVYIARPQGAVLEVLDVERIEVLRGPQGTLYGKNTIGGAVKYETRPLTGAPELYVEGRYGSYNQMDAKVSGQIPLVADKFFLGFAGATLNRDGFGEFLTQDNQDNYNKSLLTGRLSLQFQPTENFVMRLSGDITEDTSNSKGGHRLNPSVITGEPVLNNVFDSNAGADIDSLVRTKGVALHMDWDLDARWAVKSISAYREGESDGVIDFDNTALASADVVGFYADDQFSQELQLNYLGENIKAVGGLYYYQGESCGQFNLLLALAHPLGLTLENSGCVDTKSYAAFAQGSYQFSDRLSVTLGGRYTHDRKEVDVFQGIFLGLKMPEDDALLIIPNSDFTNAHSWSRFSPHVGVEYQAHDDLLLYASYKNGFKSGGIDMRANQRLLATANEPYDPEVVDAYEVGVKSEWWQRRLRLNLAAFYNKYREQQITVQRVTDDGLSLVSQVINAGRSEMKGLELEAQAAVSDALTLTATVGYIDADFKEGEFFDPNLGQEVDISENFVVSNTPEWSTNLGFSYRREIRDWAMTVIGNWAYRSSIHIFEIPSQLDTEGYGLVNLGVTFTSPDDRWTVGLHGKNILDKEYRLAGYNFPAAGGGLGGEDVVVGYYGDPATVTFTVGVKF